MAYYASENTNLKDCDFSSENIEAKKINGITPFKCWKDQIRTLYH